MKSFNSLSLVALPRVDVLGALTVSAQLITAADAAKDHPPPICNALTKLKKSRKKLREARRAARPVVDPARAQAADRRLDGLYRALDGFLISWEDLGEDAPEAAEAQRVRSALFPDGLKFTQLPYRLQWAASETCIDQLKNEGLGEAVQRLGGERFVKLLYREHARYGEVLNITQEQAEAEEATLRDHFLALQDSMRDYVVSVVATAIDGDEAAQEWVDRLLKPLAEWPMRKAGFTPDVEDDGETADSPAAPPVVPTPVVVGPVAPAPTPPAGPAPISPADS